MNGGNNFIRNISSRTEQKDIFFRFITVLHVIFDKGGIQGERKLSKRTIIKRNPKQPLSLDYS